MKISGVLVIISLCLTRFSSSSDSKFESSVDEVSTVLQLKESVLFSHFTTNIFLDIIRGLKSPTLMLEFYAKVMSSPDNRIPYRHIEPVIMSYAGFATCLIIGLLFITLMPLIGLIFCCMRCCGKCGGRVQLMDSKRDPCKRGIFAVCTVIIVTIQLIAVVLAYINNFLVYEALINRDPRVGAFPQLNSSILHTEASLREMFQMAVNASSVDLDDRNFMSTVDTGLLGLQKEFYLKSNADLVLTAIENVQKTIREFGYHSEAHANLENFNTSITKLFHRLPTIRSEIVDILDTGCPFDFRLQCQQLMQTAETHLDVRYTMDDFQSTDLTLWLNTLHKYTQNVETLDEFNHTLNNLATAVKQAIRSDLDNAWADLAYSTATREKVASSFAHHLDNIYSVLQQIRAEMVSVVESDSHAVVPKVAEFWFYAIVALLCVPAIILLLVSLGLFFGICGRRPYEEAGVCNRGVGANFMLAAVGFIFLFSTILMLLCTVLFIMGGPLQTEACRYLTGHIPDGPRKLEDYLQETVRRMVTEIRQNQRIREEESARQRLVEPSVSVKAHSDLSSLELVMDITRARLADAVLTRCEHEPFVEAIRGGQFTMPMLRESVKDILAKLLQSVRNVNVLALFHNTITLCNQALQEMSSLNAINFSKAIEQTKFPLTHIDDLEDYVAQLRSLGLPRLNVVVESLEKYAISADKLREQTRVLYTKLNTIPNALQYLQSELSQFDNRLTEAVRLTMDVGVNKFEPVLSQELQLALIASWRNIPCRSLRLAVKGGVDAICVTFLMPLNVIWSSLGLTLLLFIPLIVFAVKLAGLYRKTEKYSSDYEEPDYISYHGFYIRPNTDYYGASKNSRGKKQQQHKGYSLITAEA